MLPNFLAFHFNDIYTTVKHNFHYCKRPNYYTPFQDYFEIFRLELINSPSIFRISRYENLKKKIGIKNKIQREL